MLSIIFGLSYYLNLFYYFSVLQLLKGSETLYWTLSSDEYYKVRIGTKTYFFYFTVMKDPELRNLVDIIFVIKIVISFEIILAIPVLLRVNKEVFADSLNEVIQNHC